jgi:bacterioferritin-associated ferredoxin
MARLTDAEIIARFRVVCICKGIKMGRICDAIVKGCTTVKEVNRATGSGSGDCKATRCTPVILEVLKNKGRPPIPAPWPPMEPDDPTGGMP